MFVLAVSAARAADADPSAGSGSATGSDAGSAAGSDDVKIAQPAPDAPPAKVEQAKEVGKVAELHPIIPNPSNPTRPAYLLYAEIDPPILATGLVFALGRRIKIGEVSCGAPNTADPVCPKTGLNALDSLTAGYYSAGWSRASDIGLYSTFALAFGTLVLDEGLLDALNDGVVVGEATLSATAVASVMTLAAGRPRPFMYGSNAPESVRLSADGGLSFISSHTAMTFAVATSMFFTERRLHPHSPRQWWVLGAGAAVGTFIAVARVESGYHFITDVIGGAVIGTSVGVIVTSVHKSPVEIVPVVNHDPAGNVSGAGLGFHGSF